MSDTPHTDPTDELVTASDFSYLFGDRKIVFVKYPLEWTGAQVVEKLNWAKTYAVESLYDSFMVRAIVKPRYLQHFLDSNKDYVVKHRVIMSSNDPDDIAWEVEEAIYGD